MTAQRGVRSLPDAHWISLDQALAWICFDEAFDIDVLLTSAASDMGLTPGEAKTRYQEAWRDFAEQASRRGFEIRGRRRSLRKTENYMRQLSADDLFNCRFVDFDRTTHGRTILLSRRDCDEDGVWEVMFDQIGSDFLDVVVRRSDLLAFKNQASPKATRRKATVASGLAAFKHLSAHIDGKHASEIRRDDLIQEMCDEFGITQKTARNNWKAATAKRPDLTSQGRRKRAETNSDR